MYPYAADWVRDLKKKGYKVYILSNFSEFGFNRVKDTFDFLPYADGALISYEVKLVKPDRKIYETLCERFDITPENAVFSMITRKTPKLRGNLVCTPSR